MSPTLQTLANGSAYGYRTLAAAGAGSYESIATATPSGTNTVSFTSIPSTYTSLQIRISLITNTGGGSLRGNFNNDTTSANYIGHYLVGNGSSVFAGSNSGVGWLAMGFIYNGMITTYPNVTIIDIHDYASTTKNKTVRVFSGADANGSGASDLISGLWMSTSAINRIDLVTGSGQYQTGSTVSLYGIKGA